MYDTLPLCALLSSIREDLNLFTEFEHTPPKKWVQVTLDELEAAFWDLVANDTTGEHAHLLLHITQFFQIVTKHPYRKET